MKTMLRIARGAWTLADIAIDLVRLAREERAKERMHV